MSPQFGTKAVVAIDQAHHVVLLVRLLVLRVLLLVLLVLLVLL
jgi:hypothetical protein